MFDWCPRPEKDNGIGLHDDGNAGDGSGTLGFMHSLIDAMADLGFSWLKVLMDVNHKSGRLALIEHARRKKIMVIVRPFRQPCHPRGLDLYEDFIKAVLHVGGSYVEVGNEPNLAKVECWKFYPAYEYGNLKGHAAFVNLLYDQWCSEADKIRRLGGIPLFPALSPTAYTNDEVFFHHALYEQIIGLGKLRGDLGWAFEGAGIAIHNRPSDNSLDVIDRCAFRDYEWIEAQFKNALGREIPLFGTEAGYEDGMVGTYILHQLGNLYPNNNDYIRWHKILNHEMFARFNPQHPKAWHDYLMCECAWLAADNGWYASGWARNARVGGGALPSFTDLREISQFTRAEGAPYIPPEEEPLPPPPSPLLEVKMKAYRSNGSEMDPAQLLKEYAVGIQPLIGPGFRVVEVRERCEAANCDIWALDAQGTPLTNYDVRWRWPGMEVVQRTDPYGRVGFAMAHSAYYDPKVSRGPHETAISGDSEMVTGIGMVAGTFHCTLNFVFRYTEVTPIPEPPTPEPPTPQAPYDFKIRMTQAPHGYSDLRSKIEGISDMKRLKVDARMDAAGIPIWSLIEYVVVHHGGASGDDTWELAKWAIEKDGKATLPYHICIESSGKIVWGTRFVWVTEATANLDKISIHVCLLGDWSKKKPPQVMLESGRFVIAALGEFFGNQKWSARSVLGVLPHNRIKGNATSCPGKVWPAILGEVILK